MLKTTQNKLYDMHKLHINYPRRLYSHWRG